MTSPSTEAGRALQRNFGGASSVAAEVYRHILAIEAEARDQALAEIEEAVRGLPTWDKRSAPGGFHVNRAAVLAAIETARRNPR